METVILDLRYGARSLRQQPGFAAVALLTLALGIGANTAIFSVLNAVLLRPLPYGAPDRVVMIWSHWINWNRTWLSEPEFADYRRQCHTLEQVSAFTYNSFNLTGAGEAERVQGASVSAELFRALGVEPIAGRVFTTDEDQPGRNRVVVISEGLWRNHFGSNPALLGRPIMLDGANYTVIGIMSATLRLPLDYRSRVRSQLWVPIALPAPDPQMRGSHYLNALGVLKPGITLAQAQAEMDTITRGFLRDYPQSYDREFGVTLVPAADQVFGDIRPALIALLGAVICVLLIACANVANLLLARSEARQKEVALRTVLGADRRRLVRQLLTESILLSSLGGALGIALAWGMIRIVVYGDPLKIPRVQEIGLDLRTLGFTTIISVATGVLFGLVPALQASNPNVQQTLKEGGRDSRVGTRRLRSALVAAEIVGAMVLVIGATLLARSFERLLHVESGFKPDNVLTMRMSLPEAKYTTAAQMVAAFRRVGGRLAELPGVQAAGGVTGLPLASTRGDWSIAVEGRPVESNRSDAADWQIVTPDYFKAIGTPLRRGRFFTAADAEDTLGVIIVNETMARKFWPDEDPIGRRLRMGGRSNPWLTVVGIVADVKHRGLDLEARAEMYRPHQQFRYTGAPGQPSTAVDTMTWVLRTNGDPLRLASSAKAAIRSIDPDLPVSDVQTMDQVLADSTSDRRLNMLLFSVLGALALALAAVGVYGVVAYSVVQRTHEIGVRMAIGARPSDVLRLVVGQGCRLALAGVALGLGAAMVVGRAMRGLLFGISSSDPVTYAVVTVALISIALLASYIPARRATRVDPMVALRGE